MFLRSRWGRGGRPLRTTKQFRNLCHWLYPPEPVTPDLPKKKTASLLHLTERRDRNIPFSKYHDKHVRCRRSRAYVGLWFASTRVWSGGTWDATQSLRLKWLRPFAVSSRYNRKSHKSNKKRSMKPHTTTLLHNVSLESCLPTSANQVLGAHPCTPTANSLPRHERG